MDYVNLGHSGLKVSQLCLGCMTYGDPSWRDWEWVRNEAESRPLIKQAVDAGINFFDTANAYSLGASEEIVGRVLPEFLRREDMVVATKVFFPMTEGPNRGGLSRKHIMESIDASLKRLNMDFVDLYQIHRWDDHTPIEETLEALNDVVRAGKARYIGASSMHAWQFMKALMLQRQHGWARFIAMQNHYNLLYREEEREMIPLCRSEGIGLIPWSPLARGFLAGSRQKDDGGEVVAHTARARTDNIAQAYYGSDRDFEIAERVMAIAERHGCPPAQIAYAWVTSRPGITAPIVGASKPAHLEDALAALSIDLTEDDVAALESSYRPRPTAGHL